MHARWDEVFPQYGLAENKGYRTPEHIAAIQTYGPTSLHRFSFEPVRVSCPYALWHGLRSGSAANWLFRRGRRRTDADRPAIPRNSQPTVHARRAADTWYTRFCDCAS